MNTTNKETIFNLISNLISFVLSVLIGFFLSPYIIEHLGAEANGFTQLASNFVNYASLITIALNSMAARFMSVEYHQGDLTETKKYYSSLVVGNVFIMLIFIVPAWYIIHNLDKLINIGDVNPWDIRALFFFVFSNYFVALITSLLSTAMYVKNKLYYQNLISVVSAILRLLLLFGLFTFYKPRVFYVSVAGFICTLITLPFFVWTKRKLLPEIKFSKKYFDLKHIFTLVSSGIWNTINQCGNILMTGLDLLLANLFVNPVEMGILSVAKQVPNYIIQLGVMINTNFAPALTLTYASSDKHEVLKNLRWSMKLSSIFMSIPIGIFVVIGSSFYGLWLPTLDRNQLVLLSFLSCMAFVPFAGPQVLYNVYATTNKLKLNSLTVILGGLVNFIVVYILLCFTNLGIYAIAGVSSLVSIVRNLVVTVPYTAHLLKLRWYEFYKDVGISCLCFVAVFAVTMMIKGILGCNSWITLILTALFSGLLSLLSEVLILLSRQEKRALFNKILKRV